MTALTKLTTTEFRLLGRDRAAIGLTFVLPLGLLVGFGSGDGMRESLPELGGMSAFDVHIVPIALVLVVTMLSIQILPVTLATYRERGVLRRLATTPIHPSAVLAAQLLVHAVLLVASLTLTAVVGRLFFDVATPAEVGTAVLVVVLGALSLYAMGLAVAAAAPKASTATALGMGLFFPQLLLGGLMVPVDQLPQILADIGRLTPVGAMMEGVQGAWAGTAVGAGASGATTSTFVVLIVWTAVLGTYAATRFRWD